MDTEDIKLCADIRLLAMKYKDNPWVHYASQQTAWLIVEKAMTQLITKYSNTHGEEEGDSKCSN